MRWVLFSSIPLLATAEPTDHWAYRAPVAVELGTDQHPVDTLLLRQREKFGTVAGPLADPRTWALRASFSLTGLPPTPEQIARLEADPKTWPTLLEEWMTDSAYGERWARHWMDVARYADTFGYNFQKDNRFPYAWTYREWLIDAFNRDLPWSEFITLQVAADQVVDRPDHPDLAALGFLTVGPRGRHEEMIDDRVDVLTRGFMATTVSCARCHDHKTDPISTTDYYSLFSILENADANQRGPVIGIPSDEKAHQQFMAEMKKIDQQNHVFRRKIVTQIREPATLAVYLLLGWQAQKEDWDLGKAESTGFKAGNYRGKAIMQWKKFLEVAAMGEKATPRLAQWKSAMDAPDAPRDELCTALANEWHSAIKDEKGPLANQAKRDLCPLSFDEGKVQAFFTQEDGQKNRELEASRARLESTHPGGPPRAMVVHERPKHAPARVYKRGDPSQKGEPFERHWLTVLGGEKFPEDQSPRLTVAERIASSENPLTARTIVNRVWAWHFGAPLVDPGDFGPQTPEPLQLELLDWLAVWFTDNGGSLKKLHHLLLSSEAFRLTADAHAGNLQRDEANHTFWRWNRQRLSFEAIRDRILHTAGALGLKTRGGRSIELEKPEADRRRTIYAFLDRFQLPGQFVNFDLPHPDHHAPRRIETTVPQQALWFLNGPLALRQASTLVASPDFKALHDSRERITWLFQRLYLRDPSPEEASFLQAWIAEAKDRDYAPLVDGRWSVGHRPESETPSLVFKPLDHLEKGTWSSGKDPKTAPLGYLRANRNGGHSGNRHSLVARWTASGPGEFRLVGTLRRTQKGGVPLAWRTVGSDGKLLDEGDFAPESTIRIDGKWTPLATGDPLDFVLRAPEGSNCGGFEWRLRMLGRETPDAPEIELSRIEQDFPTNRHQPILTPQGDPWTDLVQMLWASNEFNFLD